MLNKFFRPWPHTKVSISRRGIGYNTVSNNRGRNRPIENLASFTSQSIKDSDKNRWEIIHELGSPLEESESSFAKRSIFPLLLSYDIKIDEECIKLLELRTTSASFILDTVESLSQLNLLNQSVFEKIITLIKNNDEDSLLPYFQNFLKTFAFCGFHQSLRTFDLLLNHLLKIEGSKKILSFLKNFEFLIRYLYVYELTAQSNVELFINQAEYDIEIISLLKKSCTEEDQKNIYFPLYQEHIVRYSSYAENVFNLTMTAVNVLPDIHKIISYIPQDSLFEKKVTSTVINLLLENLTYVPEILNEIQKDPTGLQHVELAVYTCEGLLEKFSCQKSSANRYIPTNGVKFSG